MKSLLILALLLNLSFIMSDTATPTAQPATWTCAQIFKTGASLSSGSCYPPTQGTYQVPGYADAQDTGYGSAEIYCRLNYKRAVYGLRQCAFSKCMTAYGFDGMCLCQNCKGPYYNGNAPYRSFFASMLTACSTGTPKVCAV